MNKEDQNEDLKFENKQKINLLYDKQVLTVRIYSIRGCYIYNFLHAFTLLLLNVNYKMTAVILLFISCIFKF